MSCSFCNSLSHNIRGCHDPMIGLLSERIKVIYIDVMTHYPITAESAFKSILNRRFNLRELRAVCATNTDFPTSRTKAQITHILYQYYSNHIHITPRQQEEQEWLEIRRIPTQPDPVPDFARDLEEPPEEDITWYINRTPSPTSVLRFPLFEVPHRSNYEQLRRRHHGISHELMPVNLLSHFDAVSGNIPFIPQIKKYNIRPVLVSDNVEKGEEDCPICYESMKCMDMVKLNCEHKFCGNCIKETLRTHNKTDCGPSCALCRTKMVNFIINNQEIYNLVSEHCNL